MREIANGISAPRHILKLCGSDETLRAELPDRWEPQPGNYFMIATTACDDAKPLPDGYELQVHRSGAISRVCILAPNGDLAANGCAAETPDAFVYDRIETAPDHRRRGLGLAVMAALGTARRSQAAPQLLVATEEGRALYARLGWTLLTPVAAAAIPAH
ncbi:MAG TPA: GNAT family N-acetyltransferase [Stenotrophomonas sp.]|nr:GNAT family N-acetyltransferase [Stenotrophomonas sp.]